MEGVKGRLFNIYSGLMTVLFYAFIFGTLSFGRAFSTLHLNTPLYQIFITEIFLLLNIPILLDKYKNLLKLPKIFLTIFTIYFVFASYYLFAGLLKHNMLALRDVVLPAYILFLPITFIHLKDLRSVKSLILIIVISNIVNLFSGRCLMLNAYPSEIFRDFVTNSKLFNLGLYYGIISSFIISFYERIEPRFYRFLALFILSLNVFMLIMIHLSSLWIATSVLFLFLFLILKKKFLKMFIFFVPVFILTSSTILYFDFKTVPAAYKEGIIAELKGSKLFLYRVPSPGEPVKSSSKPQAGLDRIPSFGKAAKSSSKPQVDLDRIHDQSKTVKFLSLEQVSQKNINWRLNIWKQTLRFALDAPVFGKGFGVYPVYEIGDTHQHPQSLCFDPYMVPAHNQIVTVFFKMGILGLGLFLFINIYLLIYALAYIKKCNLRFMNNLIVALLGAFVFWHTLAFFFDVIDSPPTSIFLWIIMGMIFATVGIDKSFSER
jgi:hypothetical protein